MSNLCLCRELQCSRAVNYTSTFCLYSSCKQFPLGSDRVNSNPESPLIQKDYGERISSLKQVDIGRK